MHVALLWLSWLALGLQPVALWVLMASRRGLPLPDWLLPVRGRWVGRLAWLVLLASASFTLWGFARPRFDLPAWAGVVTWAVVEAVLLLVSAAVFAFLHKLLREHLEMVDTPLPSDDEPAG